MNTCIYIFFKVFFGQGHEWISVRFMQKNEVSAPLSPNRLGPAWAPQRMKLKKMTFATNGGWKDSEHRFYNTSPGEHLLGQASFCCTVPDIHKTIPWASLVTKLRCNTRIKGLFTSGVETTPRAWIIITICHTCLHVCPSH